MIALLDIGSTLIEGPPAGPAKRIADLLSLGPESLAHLEQLLFCAPSRDAEDLGMRISQKFRVDRDAAIGAVDALWKAQLEEAYVLPGARQAVSDLKAAGIARAYLSNIWPPFYACFEREFAEEARLQPQFLSFRIGLMKPDPEFFLCALGRLGVDPREAVMIGDTYCNDIEPPLALGMRAIWVLHRVEKEKDALLRVVNGQALAPELTLGSIGEMRADHLRNMFSGKSGSIHGHSEVQANIRG